MDLKELMQTTKKLRKQELYDACRNGDLPKVRKLIESGVEVNHFGELEFSRTPLIEAIQCNSEEVVRFLLQHGASVQECFPIIAAVTEGNANIVRLLLQHNSPVDPNSNYERETSLMMAVKRNDEEIVELLLQEGKASVMESSYIGWLPIHFAAEREYMNIVKMLLQHKSPIDQRDKEGKTPLMIAVMNEKEKMVKLLLEEGNASVKEMCNECHLPIHIAARTGNVIIGRLLLKHNSSVKSRDGDGDTPLMIAVSWANERMVKLLLKEGKASVMDVNNRGMLPIHFAAAEENVNIGRILLQHNSCVDTKDEDGNTPLMRAALYDNEIMVELLLQEGKSSVLKANNNGYLPIDMAARNNNVNIGRMLLQHKTPIDSKDIDGDTPHLRNAILQNNEDMIELLLEEGKSSVIEENNIGWLPIHEAAYTGNVNIVRMLLKHNSPVNPKDGDGCTPIMHAVSKSNEAVIVFLLDEENASVMEADNDGDLPIHYAAINGDVNIAWLLLMHKSPIDPLNNEGMTPLMMAAQHDDHEMVMLFLNNAFI